MKNLVKLATAMFTLLSLSCYPKVENEEKFKGWFESARIYNYLGQEDKALDCLDSLQISVKEQDQYYKRLSKKKLLELSEWDSRAWIERGKIYRELGDCEGALKCFRTAITTYLGNDEGFEKLSELGSWDPIIASAIEKAETFEKMGKKERVEGCRKFLEKYLKANY